MELEGLVFVTDHLTNSGKQVVISPFTATMDPDKRILLTAATRETCGSGKAIQRVIFITKWSSYTNYNDSRFHSSLTVFVAISELS